MQGNIVTKRKQKLNELKEPEDKKRKLEEATNLEKML